MVTFHLSNANALIDHSRVQANIRFWRCSFCCKIQFYSPCLSWFLSRDYWSCLCVVTKLWLHTSSVWSDFKWPCSLDRHSNMKPTVKCWEEIVIVQLRGTRHVFWCQLSTYIGYAIVNIWKDTVTHTKTIALARRLHTNCEQHQQMTACTYCCFPPVHMPSYTCLTGGVI